MDSGCRAIYLTKHYLYAIPKIEHKFDSKDLSYLKNCTNVSELNLFIFYSDLYLFENIENLMVMKFQALHLNDYVKKLRNVSQ